MGANKTKLSLAPVVQKREKPFAPLKTKAANAP